MTRPSYLYNNNPITREIGLHIKTDSDRAPEEIFIAIFSHWCNTDMAILSKMINR